MTYLTTAKDIRAAIAKYTQSPILWLDTEVADYKSETPRLSLIQVLDDATDLTGERVAILDVLDQPELADEFIEKIMLNAEIEKVFHNASYDLNFLGKRKAQTIACTLEIAKKVPYYLVPLPNFQLKTLAEQLCNFANVDKTEQGSDWGQRPLTASQLHYAKMDAVYVAQVHNRLLQLMQPDPATDDIEALTLRYRQIEHRWKQLDTEINQIKERLKAAMQTQNLPEVNGFRLSGQTRTTKKVAFNQLAKVTRELGIELDLSVALTKALQKELGEAIAQLPVEEEVTTNWRLSIEAQDDGELPF
ncbi:MAG TPA: ribonuclease D [Cyanobacteria bacterium UBA8803]|nr:ribonuclease D [Cyanobacteria bacterium UBA9273]HBL59400.1 ribonuclease D [Cyanobacteria bacterium UBA8803]